MNAPYLIRALCVAPSSRIHPHRNHTHTPRKYEHTLSHPLLQTRPDVTTFVISFECVHTHTHTHTGARDSHYHLPNALENRMRARARGIAIGFIGMKRAAAAATA